MVLHEQQQQQQAQATEMPTLQPPLCAPTPALPHHHHHHHHAYSYTSPNPSPPPLLSHCAQTVAPDFWPSVKETADGLVQE